MTGKLQQSHDNWSCCLKLKYGVSSFRFRELSLRWCCESLSQRCFLLAHVPSHMFTDNLKFLCLCAVLDLKALEAVGNSDLEAALPGMMATLNLVNNTPVAVPGEDYKVFPTVAGLACDSWHV